MTKRRSKRQKGRWVRRKGHQFERDTAIELREVFPEARRHLEYQDAEANGVDIINTGLYKFQCKKMRNYCPINCIKEVTFDKMFGEVPVLVTAGDGEETLAVLPFSELIRLMKMEKEFDLR